MHSEFKSDIQRLVAEELKEPEVENLRRLKNKDKKETDTQSCSSYQGKTSRSREQGLSL